MTRDDLAFLELVQAGQEALVLLDELDHGDHIEKALRGLLQFADEAIAAAGWRGIYTNRCRRRLEIAVHDRVRRWQSVRSKQPEARTAALVLHGAPVRLRRIDVWTGSEEVCRLAWKLLLRCARVATVASMEAVTDCYEAALRAGKATGYGRPSVSFLAALDALAESEAEIDRQRVRRLQTIARKKVAAITKDGATPLKEHQEIMDWLKKNNAEYGR